MDYEVRGHRLWRDGAAVRYLPSPNTGGPLAPKLLVIHYTASGPASDVAGYFAQKTAKVSAHLVIRRDGSITQCVPFDVVGWHAGRSRWVDDTGRAYTGLNHHAIGIELENWGALQRSADRWNSWTGVPVDSENVIEARHRFGRPEGGWETFTAAQVDATVAAARAICAAYPIGAIVGHDTISPGRKSDPGPAWEMAAFNARVLEHPEMGS